MQTVNVYIYKYIHICVCMCMCMCVYACVCVCLYIYDQFGRVLKTVNSALAASAQKYAKLKQTQLQRKHNKQHTDTHTSNKYCAYVAFKFALLSDAGNEAAVADASWGMAPPTTRHHTLLPNNGAGSEANSSARLGNCFGPTWRMRNFICQAAIQSARVCVCCFYAVCVCVIKFI